MKEKKKETVHMTLRFKDGGDYHMDISPAIHEQLKKGAKAHRENINNYMKRVIVHVHSLARILNLQYGFDIEAKILDHMKKWWVAKSAKEKGKRKRPSVSRYFNELFQEYFGDMK